MRSAPVRMDPYSLETFLPIAAQYGQDRYGYVVTPNADHFLRLEDQPELRPLYEDASYCLLDSRFLAKLWRTLRGTAFPVCVGADLTARVIADLARPGDRLVVVGSSEEQVQILRARYGFTNLVHHNPPMGFIRKPEAVEACLQAIEAASPFRFCFLAVGSPQQEKVAHALAQRGRARGLALCIGASINFLTGGEKRAPGIFQKLGVEWVYRLFQDPKRMFRRYVINGPRVLKLAVTGDFALRPPKP
ncbi:MAG TPA: WecB/TagA/CpsF family glycosyltransferase [Nevskiaceae bacterium]|nr:WecB/TagA/CpsF family glycosyltransferase [Nevskiaceae bacterium]